ncbi:MAG: hypothetical protein FD169_744 [Bacillota bacterium]|nr:MAG: hypothetical protein FD169_744 [Bacillota bacterium]
MDKEYGSHVDFMQAVDELTRDRFDVCAENP